MIWPCYFLLGRGLASCLRIARLPLGYPLCQGRWAPFLYFGRSGALLGHYLARLFHQDSAFLLLGPANGRFPAVNVQCDPAIPSSVLIAPPISSPCLGANEEIYLQVIGSLGCWSLHLHQKNQMWGGEPSELLVVEGYCIVVATKPSHVVDETFCLITT